MAKIQAVWALDMGQAALKALKLVPGDGPDEILAEAFDYVEYPKILSQPDADPEALVSEALATFLDRNDVKGCKVAIAVPGQAGLVKFIKLPPVEKKRIPDIVKFEARQQIPFALEEVVWSYQQIGGEDADSDEEFTMAEVGLFAMKRDQINRAIAPFKAAGIEIDIVQMSPIALYNYITWDQLKGTGTKGSIVLLDIGADNTDLIISDGTRIWQRNVPIGGNHFTRALTKELKLTFAKAEHLKRNATKAPDPKAVFTAMRGIFNDFASEVNRSIGFYSSVNRQATILKVVGLGNGFKLPGLQKFLQQNLNGLEVEKLDGYTKLVGDEVKTAPQFTENLASFAVSYGLGLQGLSRSQLRTNLLPPEVEQVRLIRRKKPWALVASAMLMLGFTALYAGAYKSYAKVVNPEFKSATERAKSVAGKGAGYEAALGTAKGEFDGELAKGKSLVVADDQRAKWPKFLQTVNAHLPDPARDYKLDPRVPRDVPKLDKLRVHVDKVKPVYRADVAEWYNSIGESFKGSLHPLDRKEAPTGKGWIVQLLCHHYNPTPTAEQRAQQQKTPRNQWTEFGPWNYIYLKVLPNFWDPKLRAEGVHHVALTWLSIDQKWTTENGSAGNGSTNLATLLPRATPPAGEGGAMGGPGMDMMGMGMGMMMSASGMGGSSSGGMGYGMEGGMGGRGMGMMGMGMGGMPGGMGGMGGNKPSQLTFQTRTDFLIQFIWQPPTAEAPAKPLADIIKDLQAAENDEKNKGTIASTADLEQKLQNESMKKSQEAQAKAEEVIKSVAKNAGGAAPAPAGDAPAAGAPAPGTPAPGTPAPAAGTPAP